jgi:tetratricopeptide (TPR) repeat protein
MVFLEKPDPPKRERGRRRRWTLTPPPVGSTDELEGIAVLNDLPDRLGLTLFQRLGDVLLWTRTPPGERELLFRSIAGASDFTCPELVEAIAAITRYVRSDTESDASALADACGSVAAWAYEGGHVETAAAFGHAAALLQPDDPEIAFAVGRATRDCGRYSLAEVWFQRTIGLARRTQNGEAKAAGYIGWGVLEEQRGRRAAAREKFETALRTATSGGLAEMGALAHQYLIALTVPDGTFDEGLAHAVAAFRLNTNDALALARLAIDTGALLSEHSQFGTALLMYEAAFPFLTRHADRLAGLANIGRAAAAVGAKGRYAEVWAEFDRLSLSPPRQFYPESLIELAHGAATLRYWRHAASMAADAARVAREQGNRRALEASEVFLTAIEERATEDQSLPSDPKVERFAHRFKERLDEMASSLPRTAPG